MLYPHEWAIFVPWIHEHNQTLFIQKNAFPLSAKTLVTFDLGAIKAGGSIKMNNELAMRWPSLLTVVLWLWTSPEMSVIFHEVSSLIL